VRFLSCEPLLGPVDLTRIRYGDYFIDALHGNYGGKNNIHTPFSFGMSSLGHIHWVITGGESGPGARPLNPDWLRSLRDQCQAAGVAYFFKQWGAWMPVYSAGDDPDGRSVMALPDGTLTDTEWNGGAGPHLKDAQPLYRVGKKAAGRLLDGREWNELPQVER